MAPDALADRPAPFTYATLAACFTLHSASLMLKPGFESDPEYKSRVYRAQEVLHQGRRLCELGIGTPDEIWRIVERKVGEIADEIADEHMEGEGEEKEKEVNGRAAAHGPHYEGYEDSGEDDDLDPEARTLSPDSSQDAEDLTYDSVRSTLTTAIRALGREYANEQDSEVFQELHQTYTAAIFEAATPRKGKAPQKLMDEVRQSAMKSIRKERLLEDAQEEVCEPGSTHAGDEAAAAAGATARSYDFASIVLQDLHLSAQASKYQKLIRWVVNHTLDEILRNAGAGEVQEVVEAYREWVDREVRGDGEGEDREE